MLRQWKRGRISHRRQRLQAFPWPGFKKLRERAPAGAMGGNEILIESLQREHTATKATVTMIMIIAIHFFLLIFPSLAYEFMIIGTFMRLPTLCVSHISGCMTPIIIALMFRSINVENQVETRHHAEMPLSHSQMNYLLKKSQQKQVIEQKTF